MYTDQDRPQDHDHRDVTKPAPSHILRDPELLLEDVREREAGQGTVPVDEMEIDVDVVRVTAATAVTMTEVGAQVGAQADAEEPTSLMNVFHLCSWELLFSVLALRSGRLIPKGSHLQGGRKTLPATGSIEIFLS